jgi:DNA-binding LytR/AlgR family response regulator
MTLNCILIDDEPVARKLLEEYISDVPYLYLLGKAENPLKATALLNASEETVDLIFLDINMPKMSGIEFLRSSGPLPPVIMTTAYSEYALEGFELNVIDYLLKPFSFERFVKACNKAREYHELLNKNKETLDHFFVKVDGRLEKVLYDDVLFIEGSLNYVTIHTETSKLLVYLTLKGIMEQLPSPRFLKVHKSILINTSKVRHIEGNEINLGKAKVTMSQGEHDNVMRVIVSAGMIKR